MTLQLTVIGHPVPKGGLNAKAYPSGKVALFYPPQVKAWEKVVREEAAREMARQGFPVFDARMNVSARFYLDETKTTGRVVGDLDKLLRGVFDALTGPVWVDDDAVVGVEATKMPTRPGELERVELSISIADTSEHGYGIKVKQDKLARRPA